ncbi:hypothetical protein ZIOFF_001690 [Zingiber officinale]|uniref:Histone H2A n=1 Tax=Zingiber officinale TaxID=94328 RepID=A0A8J5HVQ8_ZINOF|nr:hypothetical protein ZIOFF_001690 [Zingiber officinale]
MVGWCWAYEAGFSGPFPLQKAGLQFPVGCIARYFKVGRYAQRVSFGASVSLSVVLEYLTSEVLELDENAIRDNTNCIIQLVVKNDKELGKLLACATIFVSNIHQTLLPKK